MSRGKGERRWAIYPVRYSCPSHGARSAAGVAAGSRLHLYLNFRLAPSCPLHRRTPVPDTSRKGKALFLLSSRMCKLLYKSCTHLNCLYDYAKRLFDWASQQEIDLIRALSRYSVLAYCFAFHCSSSFFPSLWRALIS